MCYLVSPTAKCYITQIDTHIFLWQLFKVHFFHRIPIFSFIHSQQIDRSQVASGDLEKAFGDGGGCGTRVQAFCYPVLMPK